ncbi:hypothetical protein [Brevibacillus sp. H7]|jgi:hypothetical protein|uniref:hypothetical protein n=1 Tax=Brevibacillus sp. H7 TaxID=3349138 RepID=UPI00382BE0CA
MMFTFGQKIQVKTKKQGTEFIYPALGMVLQETSTDVVLLFPDGKVKISKADLL